MDNLSLLQQFLIYIAAIFAALEIAVGLLMGGKDDDFDGMA